MALGHALKIVEVLRVFLADRHNQQLLVHLACHKCLLVLTHAH